MKIKTIAMLASLIAITLQTQTAFSYQLKTHFYCAGYERWQQNSNGTNRNILVKEKQYRTSGLWHSSNTMENLRTATKEAYDAFVKEELKVRLFPTDNHTTPNSPTHMSNGFSSGSWLDDGNEISEIWYEKTSTLSCSGSGGCEGTDNSFCFLQHQQSWIIASDVQINAELTSDAKWLSGNTFVDPSEACARDSGYTSSIAALLHEIGHSYGLGHDDSKWTIMNSVIPSALRCENLDFTAFVRALVWPDEAEGLRRLYSHENEDLPNFGGTSHYQTSVSSSTTINRYSDTPSNSIAFLSPAELRWTFMSFYKNVTTQVSFQYFWIELGQKPSSSNTYLTGPTWRITPPPKGNTITVKHAPNLIISLQNLPPGKMYRLWVRLDPTNQHEETNEWDNWIPLDIKQMR